MSPSSVFDLNDVDFLCFFFFGSSSVFMLVSFDV
jgi:hypothetical protein